MALPIKFIIISVFLSPFIYSEWDPSILCKHHSNFINELNEDEYVDLKGQVSKDLKNSWCSDEKLNLLMDLTVLTKPRVCVEVGVFTGSSLLPVAATLGYLNSGKIYAVDAWSNEEAILNLNEDDPNRAWWSQIDMRAVYGCFKDLINHWSLKEFCIVHCKSSKQAVDAIPKQIDFLHLDGNYSEVSSLQDVELYLPKVKPGGYILLSNFYLMVHRDQPKVKAFCALCEACDIIATIENDNAVLFQKTIGRNDDD